MTIKIEKNVPLPSGRGGKVCRYPLGEMEIGDSFLVELEGRTIAALASRITASITAYCKAVPGKKFTTRRVNNGTAIRVWRMPPKATILDTVAPRTAAAPSVVHVLADEPMGDTQRKNRVEGSGARVVHGKRY